MNQKSYQFYDIGRIKRVNGDMKLILDNGKENDILYISSYDRRDTGTHNFKRYIEEHVLKGTTMQFLFDCDLSRIQNKPLMETVADEEIILLKNGKAIDLNSWKGMYLKTKGKGKNKKIKGFVIFVAEE